MRFICDYCDIESNRKDDSVFDTCKQHNHEILEFLDELSPVTATVDNDKSNKNSNKKTTIPKIKGYLDRQFYVESVLVDGKPKFLAKRLDSGDVTVKEIIETQDHKVRPLENYECGYYPYSFTSSEVLELTNGEISKEELLDEIKGQIDRFIVAKDLDKHLILGNILLSYAQEWIHTLHYPFFVGETESGKSTALHLGKYLNYRCLYGEDIPMADIYNFLGSDEEGTGTIAEDEAQEIIRDREKIRMYKNSYSKGSVKARILLLKNKKQQVFYKTFCPKWFAGEKILHDKGFLERLAIIYMIEGEPKSNIKRATEKEAAELNQIRNKLLVWKLQNIGKDFQRIDSGLKGRDQELWEDFISVVQGTKYFDKCKRVVTYYIEQRHEVIRNSIEAKLLDLLLKRLDSDFQINFLEYWTYITNENPEFPGTLDTKSQRTFYPADFTNIITHNSLSKILEYKFQAKKHVRKNRDENGIQHQKTLYTFNKEVLQKLVSKYKIDLPIDSTLYGSEPGQRGEQNEDTGNHVHNVHDNNELGKTIVQDKNQGINT